MIYIMYHYVTYRYICVYILLRRKLSYTFPCWTLFLLIISIFTGCVQDGLTLNPASMVENGEQSGQEKWQILFKLSGGVAGYQRTMKLSSSGVVTVADEKSGREVTGKMTEKEMSEIVLLTQDVMLLQPSGRVVNCADCLNYDLAVRMNDRQLNIQLSDLSLPESGAEPLISFLFRLQERIFADKTLN